MLFYSTKRQAAPTNFETVVMQGLPPDNGLYMPETIPKMPFEFWDEISGLSFPEMSFQLARTLLQDSLPPDVLKKIVGEAINFPAPVVQLTKQLRCLELFHGPSHAFKDFGARFMAKVMGYYVQQSSKTQYILVATSGDTGGAVAQGFLKTPGIEVIILYPSGKVSQLQEQQLTTLGNNITALEIDGTFDDCQRLVKTAFLDDELLSVLNLSSANSINLARLIPQAFYYLNAWAQVKNEGAPVMFSVPSGNFGNLTAGLLAWKMGLPIQHFIAANNANDVFTQYHQSGLYEPRPSVQTYSNAMDVGNPSNFLRILDLFEGDIHQIRSLITAYTFTDQETLLNIGEIYQKYNYTICPHTAVACLGALKYFQEHSNSDATCIFLATAHPSKFLDIVEPVIQKKIPVPENLAKLLDLPKKAKQLSTGFEDFKAYLMSLVKKA